MEELGECRLCTGWTQNANNCRVQSVKGLCGVMIAEGVCSEGPHKQRCKKTIFLHEQSLSQNYFT